MILRSVFGFVFALCLHVGLTANLQRQELSIPECAAKVGECDESKGRPVCGTDGQTYPTRCHLLRVQCSGHQVSIRYRGLCKACNVAREYALKHRTKNPLKFIPRCKKDGTYASIQCLTNSGCWCSDITGTPIDNTTVRTVGRLKCREFNKAYTRRSPSRNSSGNKKRSCSQDDRATFNTNLIGLFHSEYLRMGFSLNKNRKAVDAFVPTLDEAEVLNWKFTDLDVNSNQMLDKNEYRELKKLVKRAVKPRRCGRAFGKFCDVDSDARLSRLEFNSCLSKDGINILSTSASVSTKSKDNEPDYAACLADRKDALTQNEENLKNGKKVGHVPICTTDGRFQRVQCYDSICWCANEETGETLNGTSVKNRVPQCGAVTRAMKGCPNEVKLVFLKDLKEFLKTKIIAGSNEGANTTQWKSEDERIATLSYVILDKNKNKSWEKKEWKIFRELVANNRTLRRCGRKMPRYCDVNGDKKISLSEWLSCLQSHRVDVNTQPDFKPPIHMLSNDTTFAKPPKLNGTNPLTIYLT
ncbi:SPARC-related modular calcium-binding protein 2 isoform X3 [Calliphora vicina]|uniref:SPARC-related modular calcium-binding protein 2 isoform X3 n=1 Tax=Calliphora vicina TaxID=7373 RepID=UPI00325AC63B